MYTILIQRAAKKKLLLLPVPIRTRIVGHIQMLGNNPDDMRLDIKKLQGMEGFRLRVGQWRVIFKREDQLKILTIEKVGARGDIYK